MDATYQTSLTSNQILADGREFSDSKAAQQQTPPLTPRITPAPTGDELRPYVFNEGWADPAQRISCLRKGINIFKSLGISLGGMLHLLYLRLCCCMPPLNGDHIITTPALALPDDVLLEQTRILINHSELLWPNDRTEDRKAITLPKFTENFLAGADTACDETPADDHDGAAISLQLPAQCVAHLKEQFKDGRIADEKIERINKNLSEIARGLEESGFIAYKNGMLLLHPKAHVCCALIYDERLQKIFLHFRDTASNDFWEKGCGKHNWRANFGQGLGLLPKAYSVADMLVYNLKQALEDVEVTVVGYSMGGGLAIFSALRNSMKAIGINPAFPSKMHRRFYPEGWEERARDNICAISTSNDLLSRVADNPATGGILPTQFPAGAQFFTIDGPEQRDIGYCCKRFKESLEAHFIPNLVAAYLHAYCLRHRGEMDTQFATIVPKYSWEYLLQKYPAVMPLKTQEATRPAEALPKDAAAPQEASRPQELPEDLTQTAVVPEMLQKEAAIQESDGTNRKPARNPQVSPDSPAVNGRTEGINPDEIKG